ncbi:hypothetical protein TWF594_000352 [Orbilia oligospora]|nr:hypothetical protein TWF594_000352 [Orbilia oligospora]
MASIIKLPTELKVEVLGHLASTTDLESISKSCRGFHDMTTEPYWNTIQNLVFKNETAHQLSKQLIGISKLRNYKASSAFQESKESELFAPPNDQDYEGDLSQLTDLRLTIRWFTKRFLRHHLPQGEPAPSEAEISRIDQAFCVLWLWMESSYEPTKRGQSVLDAVWWATQPHSSSEWYFQEHGVIAGTLLAVYWFLKSQLEHIGPLIAQRQDKSKIDGLASLSCCLDQYFRVGIPNIILINEGLDGVKEILEAPLESQLEKAFPYFDHLDYTKGDKYALWGGEEIFDHFVAIVGSVWSRELDYSALSLRPLWRSPNNVYKLYSAIWDQHVDFDYMSTFWDDDRLLRRGYHPPLDVSEFHCPSGYTLTHVVPEGYICKNCQPEWRCTYQYFWRKGYFDLT